MRVGIVDNTVERGRAIAQTFANAKADVAHFFSDRWRDLEGDALDAVDTDAAQKFDLVLLHVEDAKYWRGANVLGETAFKYSGGWSFSERANRGSFIQRVVNADSITVGEARALMDWVRAGGGKPRLLEPNEEQTNMLAAAVILCQGFLAVVASEAEGEIQSPFMHEALAKMGWSPAVEVRALNGVVKSAAWWKTGLSLSETAVTAPEVFESMPVVKSMIDRALTKQGPTSEMVAEAYLQLCNELETIG